MTGVRAAAIVWIAMVIGACAPRFQDLGPAIAEPKIADDAIVAADGVRLPLRIWLPKDDPPKAVVVALHGFNDYGNFFDAPGMFLADRGIAAYAYDQRGFGAAPSPGVWAGMRAMQDDARTAARLIRARHPGLPLYLLGESMGAAVLMTAATSSDPPATDGYILSAPAVWGRTTMPWYQRVALWLGVHTFPWATVTGRGLDIMPSDNIEMLRALGRDPLVIKETRIDAIYGLVNLMDAALESSSRFDARALILYGEKDEIIPKRPTYLMLTRLPPSATGRQKIAIYGTGYHMLLRDLKAEIPLTDIAAWVAESDAALPSGADRKSIAILNPDQSGIE